MQVQAVPEQEQESLPASPAHKGSLPAMHIGESCQPSTQGKLASSAHAHKTSLPNPAHKTSLPNPAYKTSLASGHKASLPNILEEETRAKEEEMKVEVNFQLSESKLSHFSVSGS